MNIYDIIEEQTGLNKEGLLKLRAQRIKDGLSPSIVLTFDNPDTETEKKKLQMTNAKMQAVAIADQMEREINRVKVKMSEGEPIDWRQWYERVGYEDLMNQAEEATDRYSSLYNEYQAMLKE